MKNNEAGRGWGLGGRGLESIWNLFALLLEGLGEMSRFYIK